MDHNQIIRVALGLVLLLALTGCEQAIGRRAHGCSLRCSCSRTLPAILCFDRTPVGQLPDGWVITQTNPGKALAKWEVIANERDGARAFALTRSENQDHTYNLAIAGDMSHRHPDSPMINYLPVRDVDLKVAVKAIGGTEDQGGGPIWRCVDENNYYICRFNPLENNFRVYTVVNGRRTQLASADVETEPDHWYVVRVVMIGTRIVCYLDDTKYLEVEDDTFSDAGRVGLWTKADATTAFSMVLVADKSPTP